MSSTIRCGKPRGETLQTHSWKLTNRSLLCKQRSLRWHLQTSLPCSILQKSLWQHWGLTRENQQNCRKSIFCKQRFTIYLPWISRADAAIKCNRRDVLKKFANDFRASRSVCNSRRWSSALKPPKRLAQGFTSVSAESPPPLNAAVQKGWSVLRITCKPVGLDKYPCALRRYLPKNTFRSLSLTPWNSSQLPGVRGAPVH